MHASLEEPLPVRLPGHDRAPAGSEHPVQQDPLGVGALRLADLQRGSRREGDEVNALIAEAPGHLRQERQAVGMPDFETADDVEATEVLACDLAVGADVDDVDAL